MQGFGLGRKQLTIGEACFNTSMTGYQEIMTDPSYSDQIINFTFPHIGNIGTNSDDFERRDIFARGAIFKEPPTAPSNWRSEKSLQQWLEDYGITAIWGVDTRAITQKIRDHGAQNIALYYSGEALSQSEIDQALAELREWPGLKGQDLARQVSRKQVHTIKANDPTQTNGHIVAIDYGMKNAILECLKDQNLDITILPANCSIDDIRAYNPDGVFLSNGPGDPQATARYAVPVIQELIAADMPIFGICLGHQLLGRALGCQTIKMHHGHRGANQPVKHIEKGHVEITSQNHGFCIDRETLPGDVVETHISLFDNSNQGITHKDKPVFSVQYHPEATPGPQDSRYLFENFVKLIRSNKEKQRPPLKKAV